MSGALRMSLPRLGVRTRLRAALRFVRDVPHRRAARRLGSDRTDEYRRYLDVQVARTLSKRSNDPGVGARILAGHLVDAGELGGSSSVLCVGCRNPVELDLLQSLGVGRVVGIDLVSQREDILVMDMHQMTFPASSFDAVYCSHALEHSFDPAVVVAEIARVARPAGVVAVEVPLGDRRSTADRLEFRSLPDLRSVCGPIVAEELWVDEQPAGSATNAQGTPVARLVFRLPSGGGRTIAG
jgi:SAM-dependent methyltransferase